MVLSEIEKFTPEEVAELAERVVCHIEETPDLTLRITKLVSTTLTSNPDIACHLIEALQDKFPQSVLSGHMIKKGIEDGSVVIEPFREDRLQTSSYDVSLGEYYWTTRPPCGGKSLFNPHNPNHVNKLWQGPNRAKTVREYLTTEDYKDCEADFEGLKLDDPVIILAPHETILAHTMEFIGGRHRITSMMKARSSWGRAFLSVCKDAGWGDVGYFNRWTMEINNNLPHAWSIVPVGQPIAQIVLFRVNPVNGEQYGQLGTYQKSTDIEELKARWTPKAMLPNLRRKTPVFVGAE